MAGIAGLESVGRRALAEITPSPKNPRKISQAAVDAVAASLQRFGWQQPIVVDSAGEILVGHTRRLAALALGETEVPVVEASNLTAEEAQAYRIADNRSGEYSRWEYDALAQQLGELGDDLAGVLGVENWGAVMAGLDAAQAEAQEITGLKAETEARLKMSVEYTLTFDSQEQADAVLHMLSRADGTCDIRAKR